MIIENCQGEYLKKEVVKSEKALFVEIEGSNPRKVLEPFPYPYGFLDGILSGDGDFIDAFLIDYDSCNLLDTIVVHPKALIRILDEGEEDSKVICTRRFDAKLDTGAINTIIDWSLNYSEDEIKIVEVLQGADMIDFICR